MAHSHSHTNRRRLAVALAITLFILFAEIAGAWLTNSLALAVDAGHMLNDAAGLIMALTAASLALRPATKRHTWGFRRAEILAACGQAMVLLAVGGFAIVEGVRRLATPPEVDSHGLLFIGVIGLLGNIVSLLVLSGGHGHSHNLNMKAALLEVLNDALGSFAVILSAVVIAWTGFARMDAIVSLFIATLILPRAAVILWQAVQILLEATPAGLDLADVQKHILEVEHVVGVHDLHASQISSELPVLTAHVVLEDSCFRDGHAPQILDQLQKCLAEHFEVSVTHSTFQFEPAGHRDHEASRTSAMVEKSG